MVIVITIIINEKLLQVLIECTKTNVMSPKIYDWKMANYSFLSAGYET